MNEDPFSDLLLFPQRWFRQGTPVFQGRNPGWDLATVSHAWSFSAEVPNTLEWSVCVRWVGGTFRLFPLSYGEL